MLPLRSRLLHAQLCLQIRRNVFVMSTEKRNKLKKKSKPKPKPAPRKEESVELQAPLPAERIERLEYMNKLGKFRELRDSTARILREPSSEPQQTRKLEVVEEEEPEEPQELQNDENFDPSQQILAAPAVAVPESITDRLGLAVKYLVNKDHQNWSLVLDQLQLEGGFKDISPKDVRLLAYSIPVSDFQNVFPKFSALMAEAGIAMSPKILNTYMRSLLYGSTVDGDKMTEIQKCADQIKELSKGHKMPRITYELLVQAYGKNLNVQKMNEVLAEMQLMKLTPSKTTYSNVLSTCVYKAKDHKTATELFDYMKFESAKTQPSTKQYQHMIVSHVINDNVEKALDLYDEMLQGNIPLNQAILQCLARGCSTREHLKVKAWHFMFEIYEKGWNPTVETAEFMIYLCAKDGDLAMARAVYQQLNLSQSLLSKSFAFLMKAYATASTNHQHLPSITLNEAGRKFRNNLLAKTNLHPKLSNPRQMLPFLPLPELREANEIMAESSAMMAHSVMVNPSFLVIESINNYLNVAATVGTLEDFIDRFNEFTFLDKTGIPQTRYVLDGVDESTEASELEEVEEKQEKKLPTKSPLLSEVMAGNGAAVRKPRNSLSYIYALKAAGEHRNYKFAQQIWTERGSFRKSDLFKNMLRKEKDKQDFEFAIAMVNALTTMGMYDDALAIIVSTEYQFKWTWAHFRDLYDKAATLSFTKITQTLRGIASRAQINYAGKLRKKDYKRYLVDRRL